MNIRIYNKIFLSALDLKNDAGAVYKGLPKHDKPDCTFILEDDLFSKIMDGSADPQKVILTLNVTFWSFLILAYLGTVNLLFLLWSYLAI